jgi:hypothetical protein
MRASHNQKSVWRVNVCRARVRFGGLCAITVILAILYSQKLRAHPTDLALPIASYQDDAEYETIPPPEPSTDAGRNDLRSAIRSDPELAAVVREEAEMIIASQLAGIPRPRYIPATSLVDLKGLEVYASRNRYSFPFSFYLNGFVQVRWFEFARSVETWTASGPIDGKGGRAVPTQYPVNNINDFEINRFFLTSEGYVTDERLRYSLTLFGTTNNGNNSAIAPLGFAAWKFNDQVTMSGGVSFVAATREWGTSSRWVQGIDRSMANTFFRPSYSPGFEFKGKLLDGEFRYRGGVWNGIDGSRAGVNRSGTAMAWAGIVAWEPLGTYGPYYSDMEVHRKPVVRLGCSGMHALTPTSNQSESFSNPEDTLVRLSNGTPISAPGAIQADTKITRVRVQLATVDIGWKHQGTAINFEYYFRLLDDYSGQSYSFPPNPLVTPVPVPVHAPSIFQQGGAGSVSFCLIPRRLGIYGRSGGVTGLNGSGQEYGGGFNFYPKNNRQSKFTFEALYYNRSPANNALYPYRAGYSGTAIQTQMLVMW